MQKPKSGKLTLSYNRSRSTQDTKWNLMGVKTKCFIPSFKVISLTVLEEKIFKGLLSCMGMVAILVMWHRSHKQIFVPSSHWGSRWNLALISPVVSEKMMLENGWRTTDNRRRTTYNRRRTEDGEWPYYKLSCSLWLLRAKNPLFSLLPIQKSESMYLTLLWNRSGHPRVNIWTNYDGSKYRCYMPSYKFIGLTVLE